MPENGRWRRQLFHVVMTLNNLCMPSECHTVLSTPQGVIEEEKQESSLDLNKQSQ
jgi:hypothetical protein